MNRALLQVLVGVAVMVAVDAVAACGAKFAIAQGMSAIVIPIHDAPPLDSDGGQPLLEDDGGPP